LDDSSHSSYFGTMSLIQVIDCCSFPLFNRMRTTLELSKGRRCLRPLVAVLVVVGLGLVEQGQRLLVSAFSHPKLPLLTRKERWVHASVSLGAADEKKGYKFGDLSKKLAQKITGKETYQLGDVSKWLDQQAKGSVSKLTNKTTYEFGDLTRWADSVSKEKVSNFTGSSGYEVGDISKEVLRRARSGEYKLEDMFLALRILLSAGASLTPLASVLPLKVLLELVNLGLASDITGRLVEVLAVSLDERMKEAITGDSKYQVGDFTKKKAVAALATFTGKETYEFGDISRKVAQLSQGKTKKNDKQQIELQIQFADDELVDWDRKFQEQSTIDKDKSYSE
jgi:hypothetical protein